MALDFGKLNYLVSLDPQTAFPIDKRSYFENKALAEAAAKEAKEAGSTATVYFYGQELVVYDTAAQTVTKYIILPTNELKELTSLSTVEIEDKIKTESDQRQAMDNQLIEAVHSIANVEQIDETDSGILCINPYNVI